MVATETAATENIGREEMITFGRTLVDGTPTNDGLTLPADSPTLDVLADARGRSSRIHNAVSTGQHS